MLTPSQIHALIPHSDTMALIDRVVSWDADMIVCESVYPTPLTHPLSIEGTLSLFCLAEYGAQAMAIHGAVTSGDAQKEGYLVALRDVIPHVAKLPSASAMPLSITATMLYRDASSSSYRFSVCAGGTTLLEGQAVVVVKNTEIGA